MKTRSPLRMLLPLVGVFLAAALSACPQNSQLRPSSPLPTVTSAAGAALVIVQDILRDSAYVSPRLHWGLFDNLQNLNRAAQAVSDDDGKDAAASELKEAAFTSALQRTIRNAETIGTRASETEDAKEKSYALAAKLRDVTYPHVTRGAAQLGAQQPTPELNPCGDPMRGVELCLAISTLGKDAPPSTAVELPHLEMQLHNVGSNTVTYSLDMLSQGSAIEIDGIWHARGAYAGNFADQPGLVAGARSEIIRLSFQEFLVELDANRQAVFTNNLNLKPGQHSVRVRTLDVHDSSGQAITLVSNAITIDIPGVPAAMEKQALVDAVSIGGWTGLRAVPKLVEKYPDVALGAIEIGIRATPAELRDIYVIGAGLLPGDASAAFLKSQLAPTAGLHAQLRAAEALFARGDPEVVPAMIETWRSIQPLQTRSGSDAYSEAGAIINFLAKTGDIRAINALEENIRSASVDVRLALVQVFLPLPKNGSLVTGRTILVDGDIANLPAGEAGAAIERSLGAALDDKGQRQGLKGSYNGLAFADPRVCDMAALVFSQRWPAKYQFHWSANIAERDSQIEVIRNTRRQEMGAISPSSYIPAYSQQTAAQQNTAQPSKPLTLAQVWTFDATYTDQQHGATFRYPSVWVPTTQPGYIPPALTASDEKPIAGFGYVEGGLPRERVVGPYSATNLEGFWSRLLGCFDGRRSRM